MREPTLTASAGPVVRRAGGRVKRGRGQAGGGWRHRRVRRDPGAVQRRLEAHSGEGIEIGAAEAGERQVARVGEAAGVAPQGHGARGDEGSRDAKTLWVASTRGGSGPASTSISCTRSVG